MQNRKMSKGPIPVQDISQHTSDVGLAFGSDLRNEVEVFPTFFATSQTVDSFLQQMALLGFFPSSYAAA